MKKLLLLAAVLPALVFGAYKQSVQVTSSGSSVSAAVPGTSLISAAYTPGVHLAVQCTAAAYVATGAGSATATTSDLEIFPGQPPTPLDLGPGETYVAVISASGTAVCNFFRAITTN